MTKPDLNAMTTEELEKHAERCYLRHMYEQAAERGYDFAAGAAAREAYGEASMELDRRRKEAAGKVPDMIDQLLGLV